MSNIKTTRGFTIVELLIVIVVIGILAAITLVAYGNIQARSRDASLSASIASLKKSIELYYVDQNTYPLVSGCADNSGCNPAGLGPLLIPNYMSSLPGNLAGVSYARNTNGIGYGFNVPYETKPRCVDGNNTNPSWGWFTSSNLPKC